ncbi:META domain-containing protein [Streptomyces tirandamycinicus]|uniref:META domain-containing protein n=1 Tax=Streptomyces TaxID=1883 RepID=UPI0010692B19|nr:MULTISPECIES: META domain-containing protein [Streptomyces]MCY0984715.1 META domain-containing protein [Streptomyces tirandamycinicus]NNJ07730.1 META domain-containing protein [Streptomyces sp. PKU-MA01144]TFE47541.1 META domain-containing protein [Streptomyces sp. ICN441]
MRTQLIVPAAAALAAAITLTACGSEKGPGQGAGDDAGGSVRPVAPVTGVHWTVRDVTVDGRTTAAPAGAHVEFTAGTAGKDGAKGRAEGNYGCNRFGADVTIKGDTITVGPGEATEMGCPPGVAGFEEALRAAFSGELKAKVSEKNLTLAGAGGDSIALTAQPAAPLVGTKWTVTSLLQGETAASLPAGTEGRAHFVIGEDGSLSGNLGCNDFRAEVKTSGSTLTVGRLSSTRKMCAGTAGMVEQAVTEALTGTVSYELDHRSLTLTSGDSGKGLVAAAG